jgi:GNAT superfamily N-acetyltransferase
MTSSLNFILLEPNLHDIYIAIGTKAYNQHYRHLWPNGNTTTYIENSFTKEVLANEELDLNTELYLLEKDGDYIGLLKLVINKSIGDFNDTDALYLDKIYILQEYTGMGIGKVSLNFIEERAKRFSKKVIFLASMQNGPALPFYLANKFTIIDTTEVPFKNVIEKEKPMYILLKEVSFT